MNSENAPVDVVRMLALVGLEFWDSHLIGGAPPSHTARFERMREPQPGDLVIELSLSGFWKRGNGPEPRAYYDAHRAIGFLDRIAKEPFPLEEGEEPWDEKTEGQPEPLETVHYIKLLDGTDFRWTNARFVTILPHEGWMR